MSTEFMVRKALLLNKRLLNLSKDCAALLDAMSPHDASKYEDVVRYVMDSALEGHFMLCDILGGTRWPSARDH